MELKNKYVAITGVSRGIGLALVQGYLAKGSIVFGIGRTKPPIDDSNFHFIPTNIRNSSEVALAFEQIRNHTNQKLNVLVNNAGLGFFGDLETYTDEQIATMFETNVYGLLYTNRAAVPLMKKQGSGHIFNISSIAGLEGYPSVSVYSATKHAVRAISESMYKELRDFAVKVTCVYPGSVKTNFFDEVESINAHDNMLMPEDVATMIIQATEMPTNFHQVNLEIRPLQPKGSK